MIFTVASSPGRAVTVSTTQAIESLGTTIVVVVTVTSVPAVVLAVVTSPPVVVVSLPLVVVTSLPPAVVVLLPLVVVTSLPPAVVVLLPLVVVTSLPPAVVVSLPLVVVSAVVVSAVVVDVFTTVVVALVVVEEIGSGYVMMIAPSIPMILSVISLPSVSKILSDPFTNSTGYVPGAVCSGIVNVRTATLSPSFALTASPVAVAKSNFFFVGFFVI